MSPQSKGCYDKKGHNFNYQDDQGVLKWVSMSKSQIEHELMREHRP